MKKHLLRQSLCLFLALSLGCAAALPASAAGKSATVVGKGAAADKKADKPIAQLPASALYYGAVKEVIRDKESGNIQSLYLSSERRGDYVMHISEKTVWIDSGNRSASNPSSLAEGEQIYIFHSPIATLSLPPQSAAFAVVRNIPQDARCAQYLEVDEIKLQGAKGSASVTANNKTETFAVDGDTTFSPYLTRNIVTLDNLKKGSRIMVWYDESSKSPRADHIMVLPGEAESTGQTAALTCSEFVGMLYGDEKRPDAEGDAFYQRLTQGKSAYTPAAQAGKNGKGPLTAESPVTRELAALIMWRKAGSPAQTAYRKLSQYSDSREISSFARQALAWAYQNKVIDTETNILGPQDPLTREQAAEMVAAIS